MVLLGTGGGCSPNRSQQDSFLFENVVGAACIPPGGKVVSAACPE